MLNQEKNLPVYDATIRWCLSFSGNISSLDVHEGTPCILLGTVEWHNLNDIVNNVAKLGQSCLPVSAIEEKVVLLEDGIPCTLQQLAEGSIKARLLLEFSYPHSDKEIFCDSNLDDIGPLSIVDMIKAVQQDIELGKVKDTTIVSLACGKAKATPFGQRSLKYKAALAAARGVSLDEIPQNLANQYLAKDILNKKAYLQFGTRTELTLQAGNGDLIGCHVSHLC